MDSPVNQSWSGTSDKRVPENMRQTQSSVVVCVLMGVDPQRVSTVWDEDHNFGRQTRIGLLDGHWSSRIRAYSIPSATTDCTLPWL
jgi:hypothetical protein